MHPLFVLGVTPDAAALEALQALTCGAKRCLLFFLPCLGLATSLRTRGWSLGFSLLGSGWGYRFGNHAAHLHAALQFERLVVAILISQARGGGADRRQPDSLPLLAKPQAHHFRALFQ